MSRLRGWGKQLRTLVSKSAVEEDLDEELAFHLEMETRRNLEMGMGEEEARRQARLAFGGVERVKEEVRDARWVRFLENVWADLRYAARSLLRRPGFALAAILTLALGIGGTTAIFGVVDAIFLRYPPGVAEPERVVRIQVKRDEGSIQTGEFGGAGSYVDYETLRAGTHAFSHLAAALDAQTIDLGRGTEVEQLRVGVVSQTYFPLLGVRPALGRFFLPEEDSVGGAHPVAVISHGFWQRRLGGDPKVLGSTLRLNGQPVTVVGVMERQFTGLDAEPVDAWIPTALASLLGLFPEGWRLQPWMMGVSFVGRLAPGTTPDRGAAEAASALRASAGEIEELDPTPEAFATSLIPGRGPNRPKAADLSLWLALVAGMVLVIAAANVANLLLARSTVRRRELALRSSLGAGRGRLLRQHLTESLLLAGLGGSAGVLIAYWGSAVIRQFPVPPSAGRLDARMLAFALAVSLLTGLLCGLLPALRASRVDPAEGLKEGSSMASRRRGEMRRALIALQVAMALVLLVGAGLFVRSLRAIYDIHPGVEIDGAMTVSMDLRRAGIPPSAQPEVYRAALERLRQVPGVSRASLVLLVPFGGSEVRVPFRVEGRDTAGRENTAAVNAVSVGYFEAAGTRILAGRGFAAEDAFGEPTAVVSSILAREIAPNGNAVGQCIALWKQVKDGGCTRIVGVAEDTRGRFLIPEDLPKYYVSWDRDPGGIGWNSPTLLVRWTDNAPTSAETLRTAVQGLRPDLPYVQVQPLSEKIRNELLPYRLGATLFSLFAVLALILAAVGVYGVLAYFVTERTQEIGIRRAIGASRRAVIAVVIRQGMAPVLLGLGIGLALAVAGSSLIASLLFGVDARDPLTFAAVAVFLVAVALLATLLPAWRAARVDPLIALRHE